MNTVSPIRLIKRAAVDIEKWDRCIGSARHSLVYCYSFYLDQLAKHWDALVLNDYEFVMPLIWNRKYGVSYLYQPAFLPLAGIFSASGIDEKMVASFITASGKHFRFAEIFLNHGNVLKGLTPAVNYVLALDAPYNAISGGYKTDLIKNLKHAAKTSFTYTPSANYKTVIGLYQQEYAQRMPQVTAHDYNNFTLLCETMLAKNKLLVREVYTGEILQAAAIFFKDNGRFYNIMSYVSAAGRDTEANPFLYDQLIREFAGKEQWLDFEGSSIPGIAAFYKKFGAIDQPGYFLRHNKLPWPLRYLKKPSLLQQ
jgi:hypothetical protein